MPRRAARARSDREQGHQSVIRQALLRFVAGSVIALIVVAAGAVIVSEHIAREQAVRDARARGAGIARGVAAPLVDSRVRAGDPTAVSRLATVLGNRIREGTVTHIKLWSRDGRVIWSDEPEIVGQRFKLTADVIALFGTNRDLTQEKRPAHAENVGESGEEPLLEVYVAAHDADGVPLVFETYVSEEYLNEHRNEILRGLLTLALGGLLVFQVTMLPLALSLARHVDHAQRQRADILRRALMSSDLERRRIAQDLHDGVIQDLAGIAYALPSVVAQLPAASTGDLARVTAREMSTILHRDVSSLRSLLTDIYPPDLAGDGLAEALEQLAVAVAEFEVAVEVNVEPGLDMPLGAARLVYRVVREGLRNVRHADAAQAWVSVRRRGDVMVVRIADDGRGLPESQSPERGHLGVKLLASTLSDVGGRLDLRPGEQGGAVLEASFPASLSD